MKRYIFLFALCALALVGCEDNTKQADTNNDKEENTIPYWWSPAGHIYISETTWENSPADDKYWVFVLNFFSNDSIVKYQTPNRDLSYHEDFLPLVDSTRWVRKDKNTILYYSLAGGTSEMLIIDTSTIYWESLDKTYSMIRK